MATSSTRPVSFQQPSRMRPAAVMFVGLSLLTLNGCGGGSSESGGGGATTVAEPAAPVSAPPMNAAPQQATPPAPREAPQVAKAAKPQPKPAGKAPFDTTFLNADTELFVYAKVGDIIESSLVQTLMGGNLGGLSELEREFGVKATDIESVTLGVSDLAKLQEQSEAAFQQQAAMMGLPPGMPGPGMGQPGRNGPGSMPPAGEDFDIEEMSLDEAEMAAIEQMEATGMAESDNAFEDSSGAAPRGSSGGSSKASHQNKPDTPPRAVAVIRVTSSIDSEKLEQEGVERIPHGKMAYYKPQSSSPGKQGPCLYLLDQKTLIVADEETIKEIIDLGDKRPRPTADLGYVKEVPHVLIAVVPKDKAAFMSRQAKGAAGAKSGGTSTSPAAATGAGFGMSEEEMAEAGMAEAAGMADSPEAAMGRAMAEEQRGRSAGQPGDQNPGGQSMSAGRGPSGRASTGKPASTGTNTPPAAALSADEEKFQKLIAEHADAFVVLVDLSAGIGLDVVVKCDKNSSAKELQAATEAALAEAKSQFEVVRETLPGMITQFVDPLVESLSATRIKSAVTISTQFPEEQQASLSMLPIALMGLMANNSGGPMGDGVDSGPPPAVLIQEVIAIGQTPVDTQGLPEGLELHALARWGKKLYGDQAAPPLKIAVVGTGGPAAEAIAFGHLKLVEAFVDAPVKGESEEAMSLKWIGSSTESIEHNPVAQFVPINRDGLFSAQPKDGFSTCFLLFASSEPADQLASFAGELKLQIAASQRDITLEDLRKFNPSQLDEPLKQSGMNVVVLQNGTQETIEVSYTDSPLIGKIEPIGPQGEALAISSNSSSISGDEKIVSFSLPGRFPNNVGLRITTYAALQEVPIAFRFENLPLPESPDLSEQQQALLTWTPALPDEKRPEDLVVEAQARWRELTPTFLADLPANVGSFDSLDVSGLSDFDDSSDFGSSESETEAMQQQMSREQGRGNQSRRPNRNQGNPGGSSDNESSGGANRATASDNPLRIVVDLIGPLPASAEAIGLVNVTSVRTDLETELEYEGAEYRLDDPTEEFVVIDREMSVGADNPPGGLRVVLKLTPPKQPITTLTQLNGSLRLRTVREQSETILKDVQDRVGRPISNRELAKFRMEVAVQVNGDQLMMVLTKGDDKRIANVTPVDLNGRPVNNVNATTREGGPQAKGHTIHVFNFPSGIPAKVGLKLKLNMGVKDEIINLRFRDIPIPPVPTDE